MPKKEITICMPVYNGEKYLPESIGSILDQSFRDFELHIYDDGSTDNSLKVVRSFKDRRIKILRGKENRGGIVARTELINSVTTPYCMWLDDDDRYCRTDAVEYALDCIKSGNYEMVNFARTIHKDEHGETSDFCDGMYGDFSYCGDRLFEKFWPTDNLYLFNSKIFMTEILRASIPDEDVLSRRFCTDDMFFSATWFYVTKRYLHVATGEPFYEYKDSIGIWGSKRRDYSLQRFGELVKLQYSVFLSLFRHLNEIRPMNDAEMRNFVAGVNFPMLTRMVGNARRMNDDGGRHADAMSKVWHAAFGADGVHLLNGIDAFQMPQYIDYLHNMMS